VTIGRMLLDWALVNLALTVLVCAWSVGVGFWRAHRERVWREVAIASLDRAILRWTREVARGRAIEESRQRIRLAAQARDPNAWDTE
jgi:hypothetical protein